MIRFQTSVWLSIAFSFVVGLMQPLEAFVIRSSLWEHPNTHKEITILEMVHEQCAAHFLTQPRHKKLYQDLGQSQRTFLTKLTYDLVDLPQEEGEKTVVVNEIDANSIGWLVEEEVGCVNVQDGEKVEEVISRIFLRTLFAPQKTAQAKIDCFNTQYEPFGGLSSFSFVLNNKLRWVLGDRYRTKIDHAMVFTVYKDWDKIKQALENQEELPEELAVLTVGGTIDYIDRLHREFESRSFNDQYYKNVSATLAQLLEHNHVATEDHFCLVHEYLVTSGQGKKRDEFNNNLLALLSQIFDIELLDYVDAFEYDTSLEHMMLIAGAKHTEVVKSMLLAKGYQCREKAGLEDDVFEDDISFSDKQWQEACTNMITFLSKHTPFTSLAGYCK